MSEVIAVPKKDFRNVPFSRHKLKSGTSWSLPTEFYGHERHSILMSRVDPNLRRIDIIGAFGYRNRIIQGIKPEHTARTLSAEYFLSCSFPIISTKARYMTYIYIKGKDFFYSSYMQFLFRTVLLI